MEIVELEVLPNLFRSIYIEMCECPERDREGEHTSVSAGFIALLNCLITLASIFSPVATNSKNPSPALAIPVTSSWDASLPIPKVKTEWYGH